MSTVWVKHGHTRLPLDRHVFRWLRLPRWAATPHVLGRKRSHRPPKQQEVVDLLVEAGQHIEILTGHPILRLKDAKSACKSFIPSKI